MSTYENYDRTAASYDATLWALATPAELERAIAKVHALEAANELDAFFAAADARRPALGQITFVHAMRD